MDEMRLNDGFIESSPYLPAKCGVRFQNLQCLPIQLGKERSQMVGESGSKDIVYRTAEFVGERVYGIIHREA